MYMTVYMYVHVHVYMYCTRTLNDAKKKMRLEQNLKIQIKPRSLQLTVFELSNLTAGHTITTHFHISV